LKIGIGESHGPLTRTARSTLVLTAGSRGSPAGRYGSSRRQMFWLVFGVSLVPPAGVHTSTRSITVSEDALTNPFHIVAE
jgi:hypothetical protein